MLGFYLSIEVFLCEGSGICWYWDVGSVVFVYCFFVLVRRCFFFVVIIVFFDISFCVVDVEVFVVGVF